MSALFLKAVRRELEPVWAADTMRKLWEMGLIPDSLRNQVATLIDKAQEAMKLGAKCQQKTNMG